MVTLPGILIVYTRKRCGVSLLSMRSTRRQSTVIVTVPLLALLFVLPIGNVVGGTAPEDDDWDPELFAGPATRARERLGDWLVVWGDLDKDGDGVERVTGFGACETQATGT
jgi:hypothetical protein